MSLGAKSAEQMRWPRLPIILAADETQTHGPSRVAAHDTDIASSNILAVPRIPRQVTIYWVNTDAF